MKKGQTESYSFLIGIIITVLILTGVGCAVYQIYRPKGIDSFDQLTKLLKDLEEKAIDAEGEIPFYVEENQVLLGFGKEQEYIGREGKRYWNCYGYGREISVPIFTPAKVIGTEKIERPRKNCPLGKSCLCLCKIKSDPYTITEDACQGDVKCETFDNLELVGGKGCPQGVFIPGRKASEGDKERGLASLYYSKQGTMVSIDDKQAFIE